MTTETHTKTHTHRQPAASGASPSTFPTMWMVTRGEPDPKDGRGGNRDGNRDGNEDGNENRNRDENRNVDGDKNGDEGGRKRKPGIL